MSQRVESPTPHTESRRAAILRAAARLFATHGFHGVTIEELGRAVGTTGPALYRHFSSKESVLSAMLLDVSERLAAGARLHVANAPNPTAALDALLRGHVDFALAESSLITVQDRELRNVPDPDRHQIRRLQRDYIEQWVMILAAVRPQSEPAKLRVAVHGVFGLLNSTPHSAGHVPRESMAPLLHAMGRAALLAAATSEP